MNRETTDNVIVYAKADNDKTRKWLFVNLRPLYVTDIHYLGCPEVNVSFYL